MYGVDVIHVSLSLLHTSRYLRTTSVFKADGKFRRRRRGIKCVLVVSSGTIKLRHVIKLSYGF